jgi:hypothetical protein
MRTALYHYVILTNCYEGQEEDEPLAETDGLNSAASGWAAIGLESQMASASIVVRSGRSE